MRHHIASPPRTQRGSSEKSTSLIDQRECLKFRRFISSEFTAFSVNSSKTERDCNRKYARLCGVHVLDLRSVHVVNNVSVVNNCLSGARATCRIAHRRTGQLPIICRALLPFRWSSGGDDGAWPRIPICPRFTVVARESGRCFASEPSASVACLCQVSRQFEGVDIA